MKNKHRKQTLIPTGSMADIAFLLLIFFLVTTRISSEKGILVRLPVWDPNSPTTLINERNVLNIYLNGQDQLMVENEIIQIDLLKQVLLDFIKNPSQSDQMPISPEKTIISLKNDRGTTYKMYITVYDQIKDLYQKLHEEQAQELYNRSFENCTSEEKNKIRAIYPMVISEMEVSDLVRND